MVDFFLDPFDWTSENITAWVSWAGRKLSGAEGVTSSALPATGRDLCALTADQFVARTGAGAGRVLHTHLAILRGQTVEPCSPAPSYSYRSAYTLYLFATGAYISFSAGEI